MERKIEKFEDLIVWKESMSLAVEIYRSVIDWRDFGLKSQIQKSAVSIPSNIAEGFERQTNKEFIQYLYIAQGSCGELRTQLYLAVKLKHFDSQTGSDYIQRTQQISAMIHGLIKTRKRKFN